MDIASITPQPFTYSVVHPSTGEPIGLSVRLLSTEDKRWKAVERRITDEANKRRMRGKPLTAVEIEQNRVDLIASVVDGFEFDKGVTFNGEELEFNSESVAKLLSVDWIRNQLDEALSEPSHFFRK